MTKMTLKEHMQIKKTRGIVKKAHLSESFQKKGKVTINEALKKEDLDKMTKIIDSIRALKNYGVASISDAAEKAALDAANYISKGTVGKAWSSLKTMFTSGKANPVAKAAGFVSLVGGACSQMPQIIKNVVGNFEATSNQTLTQLVTDEKKKKQLNDLLMKAFTPDNPLEKFYGNTNAFVKDVMNTPLESISKLVDGVAKLSPAVESIMKSQATEQPQQAQQQAPGTKPAEKQNVSTDNEAAAALSKKMNDPDFTLKLLKLASDPETKQLMLRLINQPANQ
jgi:hypothetical protein